jgi:CheY-like chemotaxis protein
MLHSRHLPGEDELNAVILVVDDNPSVRASTSRLLRAHGYTVSTASNATLAVQRANEVHPDVILMDLHMASHSGIDTAREIRQIAELSNIPIIAISATPPDSVYLSALFAAVLHKPCPSAELIAAIVATIKR